MAPVNLPISVTFSIKDETGSKSTIEKSVPGATTLADARVAANAMIPLIEAATLGSVVGYSIAATTIETEARVPLPNSRVERRGFFSVRTSAGKLAQVTLPTFNPAYILPSGRIDDDAAPVAAYRAALLGAPWSDSNGADLVSVVEAYEVYRKTSKRQKPTDRAIDANVVAESDPA